MKWYIKVLRQYADFSGRARRKEYWMFVLFNTIISLGLGFISGLVGAKNGISLLYSLWVFIPSWAVVVRRMHDVDKSGWYCLIPIYNLVLVCTEGTPGTNDYGEDPKRDSDE